MGISKVGAKPKGEALLCLYKGVGVIKTHVDKEKICHNYKDSRLVTEVLVSSMEGRSLLHSASDCPSFTKEVVA